MRLQIIFFSLIFASDKFYFTSSENQDNHYNYKAIKTGFMKLNWKIDYLNKKLNKLEADPATENRAIFVDKNEENITQIMRAIEEVNKKTDENSKIIELLFQVIEKIEKKVDASEMKKKMFETKENKMLTQFKENLEKPNVDIKNGNSSLKSDQTSNVCEPNPCLYGKRCETTTTGSGYKCTHCPYMTRGEKCEHLMCGTADKCFQRNGVRYFVYVVSGPWKQAKRICARERMTLVMPKDKDSVEFIANQLKIIYDFNYLLNFWLGLSFDGIDWRWVDGSPLGAYLAETPLPSTRKAGNCGVFNIQYGNVQLVPANCITFPSIRQVYTICENRNFVRN